MRPNDYQKLAARTECDQQVARDRYIGLPYRNANPIRVNHAVLGLAGEVGELAGAVERWLHYCQELDETNIKEELGDCLWYIALMCNALGMSLEDIMESNIAKLRQRYPRKYSDCDALEENRDREKERKVLEQ